MAKDGREAGCGALATESSMFGVVITNNAQVLILCLRLYIAKDD
jgi:hypothetical protein